MLEVIAPTFDKFHFIVYQNIIKLCGDHNETQLYYNELFCNGPFVVVLPLPYIYYHAKTKNNRNAKSKESENEEYTKNSLIDEKLVNVNGGKNHESF